MTLTITILGCSGSYAGPGGACTGYLVRSSEATVWLDAGPGTLANLQKHVGFEDLDAVVLTHAHPDHWLEIPILYNVLRWYQQRSRLPVVSNADVHRMAVQAMGPGDSLDDVFEWRVIEEDDVVDIGDQSWRFGTTQHYVPTFATRVDSNGTSFLFTSDTGPEWEPGDLAKQVDLLLCESTFLLRPESPGKGTSTELIEHLSASEAGSLAQAAQVRKLLLTHLAPGEQPEAHAAAAATKFDGAIEVVEVGATYAAVNPAS